MRGAGISVFAVMFFLAAVGISTFAQQAAPGSAPASGSSAASPPVVTLEECVEAAKSAAPGIKVAGIALDSARAALLQTQAVNGLSLAGTGSYFHQGTVPGTSSAFVRSASSAQLINGENIQGTLSLAGPSTNLDLTAQHAIGEDGAISQESILSLSGSQTVFDGYPGSRAAANVRVAGYTYKTAQVSYDSSLKSLLYQVK